MDVVCGDSVVGTVWCGGTWVWHGCEYVGCGVNVVGMYCVVCVGVYMVGTYCVVCGMQMCRCGMGSCVCVV